MPGLTNEKPTKRAEHTSRFQPTSGPAPGIYGECRPKSVIGAEPVPVGFSRHPDVRPGFQSGAAPSDCRIEFARIINPRRAPRTTFQPARNPKPKTYNLKPTGRSLRPPLPIDQLLGWMRGRVMIDPAHVPTQ